MHPSQQWEEYCVRWEGKRGIVCRDLRESDGKTRSEKFVASCIKVDLGDGRKKMIIGDDLMQSGERDLGFAEVLLDNQGQWSVNVNMDYVWREWEGREPRKEDGEYSGWVEMGKGRKTTRGLKGGKADVRIVVCNMRDFNFGAAGGGEGWSVVTSKVPTWSTKMDSLVLEFLRSRVTQASPKNFLFTMKKQKKKGEAGEVRVEDVEGLEEEPNKERNKGKEKEKEKGEKKETGKEEKKGKEGKEGKEGKKEEKEEKDKAKAKATEIAAKKKKASTEESVMQYGMGHGDKWSLDFKHLGLIQAIGLAAVAEMWEGE
ncbi:hypothetical protein TrRE_jg12402 [Triparma retinervis]|uniref:Uncharacterized protein n=1 Tax=Triparma retinervis TaxID=2557542 RepID=A0A9W7CHD1_9STRA|nr:hypothetical protein TrRE_jg12402 [Triparma retinervis]